MTPIFPPPAQTLAPVVDGGAFPVGRIFCVGRNYAAHAREMGSDPDREPPFFFTKWASAIVPTGTLIAYPPGTHDLQHEGELVVAIGRGGRNIPSQAALDHVYGYATGLDMTRRDLQNAAKATGRPWDFGKNFEQSAPLGPIHPVAAIGHPASGPLRVTVNGIVKQEGDIADMIWPVADVIAFLSRDYRLEPGDLIYTGTPAGVGPVVEGDEVVVSIAGLDDTIVRIGPPAVD
ncbi:MAG: fumarylacetoacetate hydrolase [Sphingobium sp.]|nr:MAG: fumarylacetoacetate hydrolase [Sphingobium sp.]